MFLCSSLSTVSYMEEPGHHDDIPRPTVQMENTYRLSESLSFVSRKRLVCKCNNRYGDTNLSKQMIFTNKSTRMISHEIVFPVMQYIFMPLLYMS